jgi:hypothetical protein
MQVTKKLTFNWKINKKYMFVIHVGIQVAYFLFKLAHGVDYLQCSEMSVIRKSSINMVLHEFIFAMNFVFRN